MISFDIILSVCSPIIGGIIGILKTPKQYLVYHLFAFAGGIMLAVSFTELIPESIHHAGIFLCIFGLVFGFFIMYMVQLILPQRQSLKETAVYLSIGMGIHNFAEGIAISIASNLSQTFSLVVITSIFIHNFAEGLCTSTPLYFSLNSKFKALSITSMTAIPLLLGYLSIHFIFHSISSQTLGFLLSTTAGIMLHITLCELIPESAYKTTGFVTEFSLTSGMIIVLLLDLL